MRLRDFLAVASTLVACNATNQPAPQHPEHQHSLAPPPTAAGAPQLAPPDPRALPERATFGELVQVAQAVDSAGEAHSTSGCMLRISKPARLEADLAVAARPLPPAPEQCEAAVADSVGAIPVISAWGNRPGESDDGVLVAFTTTTPKAVKNPAIGMFITTDGVLLRAADPGIRAKPESMTPDQAGVLLSSVEGPATVYATADRDLPLTQLLEAVELVPSRFEVALAVALPKGTKLPALTPPADRGGDLCPDGLPPPAASDREGELSGAAAQSSIGPLREHALACALNTGGRALLGGRLVLALRIATNGRAREACFVKDEIGEPLLRRCLVSAARDLTFPAPNPAGFADLQVPLQLELEGPAAQRPRCF
jgi:hypothetical protein